MNSERRLMLSYLSMLFVLIFCCAPSTVLMALDNTGKGTPEEVDTYYKMFVPAVHKKGTQDQISYRLLKPKNYDPKQPYPLVMFLHGAGGKIDSLSLFTSEQMRDEFPCFVLSPHFPSHPDEDAWGWAGKKHWDRPYVTLLEPSKPERLVMEVVDVVMSEFHIDKKRFYITGFSMGSFSVWGLGYRYPERIAAIVPVSGGGEPAKVGGLKGVSVWVFHGAKDDVINVSRAREMVEAMKVAELSPLYTEYPEEKHEILGLVFQRPDFFKWLFAQKKP